MPGNFGQVNYDPNAFLKGAQGAQAFNQLLAQNRAAMQFKPEDTAASQATLNGAGLYDQANKLADRPNEVRSDQLKVDQQAQTLASGKQTMDQNNDAAEWAKVGQVTDQLIRARDQGQDPATAFQAMRPMLESTMGLDPAHADQIAQQLQTNPQFLDTIHQQALGVAGNTVYDKTTGKVVIDGSKTAATPKAQVITKQNADGTYSAFQVKADDAGNNYLEPLAVGEGGHTATNPPSATLSPDEKTARGVLAQLFPGAPITSGTRTEADNKRVGGVANSMHLADASGQGHALDVVLPQGTTREQVLGMLGQAGFPATEVLNEGDHFHIGFRQDKPVLTGATAAAGGPSFKFGGKPATGGADAGGAPMDPEAVDYMAEQYATYGPSALTSLGNNKAASALKMQIIQTAREKYPNLDAGGAGADYKANQSSLSKVTQSRDASQGFERATNAAADLVNKASKAELWPTDFAPLNQLAQEYKRQSGDPAVGAYDTAVNTLAEEYAKVMTGANGNAAATEGARATAHERLNSAHTRKQADAIIKQMKVEMEARIKELSGNVEDVRQRTRGQNAPAAGKKDWSDDELDALLKGN